MAYSTIKLKPCKCGCGKNQTFNCGGYYYDHMPEEMKEKKGSKRKLQKKKKSAAVYAGNKLLKEKKFTEGESEQELWFRMAAIELESNPICMECQQWIGKSFYRSATAHILPKRKDYGFPSIATHPLNKLFLCTINGCHDKTHTWSTFATMKVWPLAVVAFKEMYPFIAESERKNIPEILRQYVPNQNELTRQD